MREWVDECEWVLDQQMWCAGLRRVGRSEEGVWRARGVAGDAEGGEGVSPDDTC